MTLPAPHWAIVDGHRVPHDGATVHVSDLGLRRGFAVFEMFRVEQGVPLFLEHHIRGGVRVGRYGTRWLRPQTPPPNPTSNRRSHACKCHRTLWTGRRNARTTW